MSDYAELKMLAEASRGEWYGVGELRYEDRSGYINGLHHDDEYFIEAATPAAVLALIAERDQLKAENEALRKSMREIMNHVDGNIRETVRDCVNGHNDVQDIYGYCDSIEGIIDDAMSKEP